MTPTACVQLCLEKSLSYAYLRAGHLCFCHIDPPAPPPGGLVLLENLCSTPCSGNPGLHCGGDAFDAVYEVITPDYVPPAFDLSLPTTVNTFTNFSLSLTELPGNTYMIDFDNGVTMKSTRSLIEFAYPLPGTYRITASAYTSGYYERTLLSVEKDIEVQLGLAATFECTAAVETTETVECILNVQESSQYDYEVDFLNGEAVVTGTLEGRLIVRTL